MKSKRHKRQPAHDPVQTDARRRTLIPGGQVNPHRAARSEIVIETRARTAKGAEIVTGERVDTLVGRLLRQNHITIEQANAAQLFQNDHEAAHSGCKSTLGIVQVDSCGCGAGGLENRLDRIRRWKDARAYLCPELAAIADAGILSLSEAGIDPTFTGIGASIFPGDPRQTQGKVGQGLLIVACRELARFYGRRQWREQHGPCGKPVDKYVRH